MAVKLTTEYFDAEGKYLGGSSENLPEYLDWMPIPVKAFWFTTLGNGNPAAKYVLMRSQAETFMTVDPGLTTLNHTQYMERQNGLESTVRAWQADRGYSRTPRNQ